MEYSLNKNYLTLTPDDCVARPSTIGVMSREDLIREISQEGTGITSYETESLFKRLETVIIDCLKKGYAINTPLINIIPSVTGVFANYEDSFDKNRHHLHFKMKSGVLLKHAAEEIKMHKVDRKKVIIDIFSFTDHLNVETSDQLQPGSVGQLNGKLLKLDATDENQGIFLIADDSTEYRVSVYVTNTNGKQIFQIPGDLIAGNYQLELRALINNGKVLQTGRLNKTLVVS
jgi:hypothetical protein